MKKIHDALKEKQHREIVYLLLVSVVLQIARLVSHASSTEFPTQQNMRETYLKV